MAGFLRASDRARFDIDKHHLTPIMKTSTLNRSHAAAWLALALGLAAAGTAHATVIYNSAPDFTRTGQNFDVIPLTGNSGPGKFRLNSYESMPAMFSWQTPSASRGILTGDPGSVILASLGDLIGNATPGWVQDRDLSNGTSYFGISFNNGGTTNYGWMQVTASGFGDYDGDQSITVNSYAYDDTGASIEVGATTSAVPETSTSFGLLALGAGGLLTRRRLKRAAWAV